MKTKQRLLQMKLRINQDKNLIIILYLFFFGRSNTNAMHIMSNNRSGSLVILSYLMEVKITQSIQKNRCMRNGGNEKMKKNIYLFLEMNFINPIFVGVHKFCYEIPLNVITA